jgi:hypothetical protein
LRRVFARSRCNAGPAAARAAVPVRALLPRPQRPARCWRTFAETGAQAAENHRVRPVGNRGHYLGGGRGRERMDRLGELCAAVHPVSKGSHGSSTSPPASARLAAAPARACARSPAASCNCPGSSRCRLGIPFALHRLMRAATGGQGREPTRLFNLVEFMICDKDGGGTMSEDECMEILYHRFGKEVPPANARARLTPACGPHRQARLRA